MNAKEHSQSKVEKMISAAEFNRFGLIFVILTIVGCMGGIAVGQGAVGSTFLLSLIVVPTMATLSLLLAVSPMKWILTAALISVIVDILIILYLALV